MATGYNHHGYTVMHDETDPEGGWWLMSGCRLVYETDSEQDARDTAAFMAGEDAERNGMVPCDTPSLPAPWWEMR